MPIFRRPVRATAPRAPKPTSTTTPARPGGKQCSASADCYWEPCGPTCKGWDTSELG